MNHVEVLIYALPAFVFGAVIGLGIAMLKCQ
jgi:hypothetical protein